MSTKPVKPTSNELYEAAVEIDRLRATIEAIDKSIMKLALKRKEAEMLLSAGTQRFAQMTGDKSFGLQPAGIAPLPAEPQDRKIGFLN